jgi:hypothetical protein
MDHPAYEQTVMHNGKWITLDEFQEKERGSIAKVDRAIKAIVYLAMAAAVVWIVVPGIWNIIKG